MAAIIQQEGVQLSYAWEKFLKLVSITHETTLLPVPHFFNAKYGCGSDYETLALCFFVMNILVIIHLYCVEMHHILHLRLVIKIYLCWYHFESPGKHCGDDLKKNSLINKTLRKKKKAIFHIYNFWCCCKLIYQWLI